MITAQRLGQRGQAKDTRLGFGENALAGQRAKDALQRARVRVAARGEVGDRQRPIDEMIGHAKRADSPDREGKNVVSQLRQAPHRRDVYGGTTAGRADIVSHSVLLICGYRRPVPSLSAISEGPQAVRMATPRPSGMADLRATTWAK